MPYQYQAVILRAVGRWSQSSTSVLIEQLNFIAIKGVMFCHCNSHVCD